YPCQDAASPTRRSASNLSRRASSICQVSLRRLSLLQCLGGRLLGLFRHRRRRRLSRGPPSILTNPVIDLTYYLAIDRFTILFRNLPMHTLMPRFLDFRIARAKLHRSDNSSVSVQDPGEIISEGSACHFHRADLVYDYQVCGSVH